MDRRRVPHPVTNRSCLDNDAFPRITTAFDESDETSSNQLYGHVIRRTFRKVLPNFSFLRPLKEGEVITADSALVFHELLPMVTWTEFSKPPFNLSFFLLCRYRTNAFKFFHELVSRWMVPGKRLNVVLFFAVDFRMPDVSNETYTIAEVKVRIESAEDLQVIRRNLPILETEARLGAASEYHAHRIMEIKGLSADEKTAMIHEYIAHLLQRRPKDFDFDIFSELQHFLVMCPDEFKTIREYRHMSRLISVLYLYRRAIRRAVESQPQRRHLLVKLMKARLHTPQKVVNVLGVLVAVNLLRDNELFEERHLTKAIEGKKLNIRPVAGSFMKTVRRNDPVTILYVEVEKVDGSEFTLGELRALRADLPHDLQGRIERRMHPIFMPQNEEEVMRHIVTLSSQLKYVRDLPQIVVTFAEQSDQNLAFTIILVRLWQSGMYSLQEQFATSDSFLEFIPDRIKQVGSLRKIYQKEANVFRICLEKAPFLRGDHSLDLYKARQVVVAELVRVLGEVRDYNGGMISKQNELFLALKESLIRSGKYHELLLENFFYSIHPVVMRSLLDPAAMEKLFLMLREIAESAKQHKEGRIWRIQEEEGLVYAVVRDDEGSMRIAVTRTVEQLDIPSFQLATTSIGSRDDAWIGYLYRCDDMDKRMRFGVALENALTELRA